jgi:iron complex transport system substrate-binding protein
MPASALLAAASVASLNLCADEYLLLLARPQEIASVSFLSQDQLESPLWRYAKVHHSNRGSIEQVLARRPSVVLTMGGGGRASALIARRLGIRAVDLRFTSSLADVETNLRAVAAALGEPARAVAWVRRLQDLRQTMPRKPLDAIWISGGGQSFGPASPGGEWLRLAGLRQRPLRGERVSLETLLVRPPQVMVQSSYRRQQVSRGALWLDHPIVRRARSHKIATDGRAWTCLGPLLIGEIERLRASLR